MANHNRAPRKNISNTNNNNNRKKWELERFPSTWTICPFFLRYSLYSIATNHKKIYNILIVWNGSQFSNVICTMYNEWNTSCKLCSGKYVNVLDVIDRTENRKQWWITFGKCSTNFNQISRMKTHFKYFNDEICLLLSRC